MKKKDIEGLARELDSQNMVGYTRNFMDDFESAISKEIDIDVVEKPGENKEAEKVEIPPKDSQIEANKEEKVVEIN